MYFIMQEICQKKRAFRMILSGFKEIRLGKNYPQVNTTPLKRVGQVVICILCRVYPTVTHYSTLYA